MTRSVKRNIMNKNDKVKVYAIFCGLIITRIYAYGQASGGSLNTVLRINVLSPGVELEVPVSEKSTFAFNPGIGMHGSYRQLEYNYNTGNSFTYFVSPFLDISFKKFYNLTNRLSRGQNINFNSGDYLGLRLLTNFKEFKAVNIHRIDHISFDFGPTWGFQRTCGRIHFLFDIGPVYYFDSMGDSGIYPIQIQFNFGINAKKWSRKIVRSVDR